MTNELKKCPFCGGEARRGENYIPRFNDVYCSNDECKASSSCEADTIEEAVSMWNTRPLEKQARIQAMQECLEAIRAEALPEEVAPCYCDITYTSCIQELINKEKGEPEV